MKEKKCNTRITLPPHDLWLLAGHAHISYAGKPGVARTIRGVVSATVGATVLVQHEC